MPKKRCVKKYRSKTFPKEAFARRVKYAKI